MSSPLRSECGHCTSSLYLVELHVEFPRFCEVPDLPSTLWSLYSNPSNRVRFKFVRYIYVAVKRYDWDALLGS